MAECWLFVDSLPVFGGHEAMLLRWLEELAGQGEVTPRLLARRGGLLRRRGRAFAVAESFPPAAAPGSGRAKLALAWRDAAVCLHALRRLRPALCVVAEGSLLTQAPFVALARLLGFRVAVYVPLLDSFRAMGFRRAALKDGLVRRCYGHLPHGWITISEAQARNFAGWAGVRRPIYTLPNTVAPEIEARAALPALAESRVIPAGKPESRARDGSFPPTPSDDSGDVPAQGLPSLDAGFRHPCRNDKMENTHDGDRGPLRVLVLGRLDALQKGLDLLLDYLEWAPASRLAYHIDLVGDGPYRATLEWRRLASKTLARRLSLIPWSDPVEAMAGHDVLLLPSRFEGVPLVMLEAMALGLPAVASDLPGTRAYLPEDCLFPVGDLAAAFAIVARLADPAARAAVARRNAEVFRDRASGAAFAAAVAGLTGRLRRELARP